MSWVGWMDGLVGMTIKKRKTYIGDMASIIGIADVSGCQRHCQCSYYSKKKKLVLKKKQKQKTIPLFQVVMCHCHCHCSDYYSKNELVIYKKKNTMKTKKKPSFEVGYMASIGGHVLKCMGKYRDIIDGNAD